MGCVKWDRTWAWAQTPISSPDPLLSLALVLFYLICSLQTTQTNLVQSARKPCLFKRRSEVGQGTADRNRMATCGWRQRCRAAHSRGIVDLVLLCVFFFLTAKQVYITSFIQFQPVSCYHGNPCLPSSQLFLLSTSFLSLSLSSILPYFSISYIK